VGAGVDSVQEYGPLVGGTEFVKYLAPAAVMYAPSLFTGWYVPVHPVCGTICGTFGWCNCALATGEATQ
jgi:hypothetical protein